MPKILHEQALCQERFNHFGINIAAYETKQKKQHLSGEYTFPSILILFNGITGNKK